MALQRTTANSRFQVASSSSQTLGKHMLDYSRSFKARAIASNGTQVLAQNSVVEPNENPAQFNILLDASTSMLATQDGKYVHEHLFKCFEDLVTTEEALRPDDIICVWTFNKRTKLLCEVKTKHYHRKKHFIREEYEKELTAGTRLYDAVTHVLDEKIRKTWKKNKNMDFFLVAFTDGQDTKAGSESLDTMMKKLVQIDGRLHTFFITVKLPEDSALENRLGGDIKLFKCESTHPREIRRAFDYVRDCIKAVLVYVMVKAGADGQEILTLTRLATYGKSSKSLNIGMGDLCMSK